MKLVGKLKEKVNKAENKEQAKELIAKAGMELNDEELDQVSGGVQDEPKPIQLPPCPPPVKQHKGTCMMCNDDYYWTDPDPKPTVCPTCGSLIIENSFC